MRRAAIAAAQVIRRSSRSSDELAYLKKGLEFRICDEPSVMAQPDGSMTRMGFRSASGPFLRRRLWKCPLDEATLSRQIP